MNQENIFKDINKGFGVYKKPAISLLKKTIAILDEFKINYFLISGTLLGLVRHNDFIPWDDDIDLIVDSSIIKKLPFIFLKYNLELNFINKQNFLIKTCFKEGNFKSNLEKDLETISIKKINTNAFDRYILGMKNPKNVYTFPFIDLFVYNDLQKDNQIEFFNQLWDKKYFFPSKKVIFNEISVSIPNIPDYFLKINYGFKYMTSFISNSYNHQEEKHLEVLKKSINNSLTILKN